KQILADESRLHDCPTLTVHHKSWSCVVVRDVAYCDMARARLMIAFLYAFFFFSGGAGLGYQMVWSRMLTAGLGHEMPAVLAVVCAFMGGMAIGACTLGGVVARSRRPAHWYAGLEILTGFWGLISS